MNAKTYIRSLIPGLLLLAGASLSHAQVSFYTQIPSRQVGVNSVFKISFIIKNASRIDDFEAPALDDFEILSGLERGMSTKIESGRRSMEVYYSLQVSPKREGALTIGSARVIVEGKTLRSKPIQIQAVKDEQLPEKVFFLAEPTLRRGYVGEPIPIDFKLFIRSDLRRNRLVNAEPPKSPDYFIEYLNFQENYQEERNNVRYSVWVISRAVLFPQKAGNITYGPMEVEVDIADEESFWILGQGSKRYRLESEPIEFTIQPLPPNPPPSFLGGVGTFEYDASINKSGLATNEALTLRLEYKGTGDIKQIQFPEFDFGDSLEVYDPSVVQDEMIDDKRGNLTGKRILEYPIIPVEPGNYEIEVPFTYFNPDSGRYVSIGPGPFEFTVEQGREQPVISEERRTVTDLDALTKEDLPPLKGATRLYHQDRGFLHSSLFWILLFLPFLSVPIMFLVNIRRQQLAGRDPALIKQGRAGKIALARLSEAKSKLEGQDERGFYDAISRALPGYVTDKLQAPPSTLSKQNIRKNLLEAGAPEELAEQAVSILSKCEMVLFAGVRTEEQERKEVYQEALELIEGLEKAL